MFTIGNLTDDAQSHIDSIHWSVYGKITNMLDSTKTISYLYNTAQERVTKTANGLTTYYVRDAQGNTLSVYDNKLSQTNWREQHLYGTSRLGMWQPNFNIAHDSASIKWALSGLKAYELTNHLGNVVMTISDARTSHTGYFTANVETAQDYYAFGALMPGRTFTSTGNYRYGFNGKENDNEVKGVGNQQDYGMRIYDPRVGRFLSVDPLQIKYPELTPYQFASNNPISFVDLDGFEKAKVKEKHGSFSIFISRLGEGINENAKELDTKLNNLTIKDIDNNLDKVVNSITNHPGKTLDKIDNDLSNQADEDIDDGLTLLHYLSIGQGRKAADLTLKLGVKILPIFVEPGAAEIDAGEAESVEYSPGAKTPEILKEDNVRLAEQYANTRPKFRKGVVEKVWKNAVEKSPDGLVRDPNTGEILQWNKSQARRGQWDMGHTPGNSYKKLVDDLRAGKINQKEFLDEYNNSDNYIPEDPSSNRSRRHD